MNSVNTVQVNSIYSVYIEYPLTTAKPTMGSAHSPTFLSLHLHHSSFSNTSVASPTSQLIFQPFRCITYVTANSPILLSLLLHHRVFTYVTWRAAHETNCSLTSLNYSRYHHYHKWTAMYCNYIVHDILNVATFPHRYGALPCGWKS